MASGGKGRGDVGDLSCVIAEGRCLLAGICWKGSPEQRRCNFDSGQPGGSRAVVFAGKGGGGRGEYKGVDVGEINAPIDAN